MMNLALIKGKWEGELPPNIYSIKIINPNQYAWESGNTHTVYEVTVHHDWEGTGKDYLEPLTKESPVFHDDGTWTFQMTSERIPKGSNGTYRENLSASEAIVEVRYNTPDDPTVRTASASFTVDIGPSSEHRYKLDTSVATYMVVNNTGMDTVLDLSSRVTTFVNGAAPVGSRLKVYALWENRDLTNGTILNSGIVEKQLVITGEDNLSVRVPNEANRISLRTLAYNERDLEFLAPYMPASEDEVELKTQLWKFSEQKFVRQLSTEAYNAAWNYAKTRPTGVIDPYRICGVSMLDGNVNAIGMVDPTGICYSYANPTSTFSNFYDPVEWDSAQFVKLFSGTDIVIGLKADGTTLGMGNYHLPTSSYLAANPFPAGVKKISFIRGHLVALMNDGTVVNRHDTLDQLKVWSEAISSWTDIVDICVGEGWIVGVKSDGTVISASNPEVFSQDKLAGLEGKFVKKVYIVNQHYPIFIHDAGRVFLPGTEPGLYNAMAKIRTEVATWPDQVNHIVVTNDTTVYGFCDDDSKKQVWCTDSYMGDLVKNWSHIVAATEYKDGIIAIRCDGQILVNNSWRLEILKEKGSPLTWSASELVPV